MRRKLFSVLLCALSLLLLMGAGLAPEEENAAVKHGRVPATKSQTILKSSVQATPAAAAVGPLKFAAEMERDLLIDGMYAPAKVMLTRKDGVSYVALANMARAMDKDSLVSWAHASQTVTVRTGELTMTAQVGEFYLEANGRYFYLPEQVLLEDNRVMVPLWAVVKAFDATMKWDAQNETISITRGSGAIQSGDDFYDEEVLFWLSRIIYAESGNQPTEGQMSVGTVVMNRVGNPTFGYTIQEVLAQRNQFSTYDSGRLADRVPNESSVIAAKLVMDGGVVEETKNALYFDSSAGSWAARNKEYVCTIGNHKFYS